MNKTLKSFLFCSFCITPFALILTYFSMRNYSSVSGRFVVISTNLEPGKVIVQFDEENILNSIFGRSVFEASSTEFLTNGQKVLIHSTSKKGFSFELNRVAVPFDGVLYKKR